MKDEIADVRTLLSAMEYIVAQDETGDLPHSIDFHCLMRELIRAARGMISEQEHD